MASVKFAKGLARAGGDDALFGRRIGHLLELVPQKNPLALKAGETLPVLVLYDGKPLEGAGVEIGNLVDKLPEERIKRYPTDAAGIAQVPLRPRGINTLAVDVERPNDGSLGDAAKALPVDKVLMAATYTFVR